MDKPPPPRSRIYSLGLTLTFLGAIYGAWISSWLKLDRTPLSARQQAALPGVPHTIAELKRFPEAMKAYINDHVGFRAGMIRAHGLWKVRGLGMSSNSQVLLGNDGWLFLAGERSLENYRRSDPFREEELRHWATCLEQRRTWLAERGIDYVFVIAPDKETIYPEFMREQYRPVAGPSRREQLVDYLRKSTDVDVLDLTEPLKRAKSQARLYFQTDTHWNAHGALQAARALGEHLQPRFPRITVDRTEQYDASTRTTPGGDLARMLGIEFDVAEELVTLQRDPPWSHQLGVELETIDIGSAEELSTCFPGAPIAKGLIFRDSFAAQWIPFIWPYFENATWVWSYQFDAQRVEREKPQIVIEQWVERKLMTVSPQLDSQLPLPRLHDENVSMVWQEAVH